MTADKHDPKAWDDGEEVVRADKEMVFVSLHHHSTFSYQDGYGTPSHHVKRAAELGMTALALCEHGNVTSHVQLEQAAVDVGIKPIFGCELYCGGVGEGAERRKNHLTVLAEDQTGYENLLKVVSRGWREGFYYEPTVSGQMLREHQEGLVILSGCSGSLLATSLVGGKNVAEADASYSRGRDVAQRMLRTFGGSFYLEVQAFPELKTTVGINRAMAELSEELGIPLVATLDAHYMYPEESELQAILHNVRGAHRRTLEDQARSWNQDVKLCPLTDREIYRRLVQTGLSKRQAEQAIRNSRVVAERCTVQLPKVNNLVFPLPQGYDDPVVLFRRWLNDGWKYRRCHTLPPQERQRYTERVKYEMELIESKGFVDYFLLVSDTVKFAKDNGIPVGPARGSAAASLVCYLLRITEIDPMPFPTLLFERFIDANRHDLPDIDLDFDDEERWRVRAYLVDKYGEERIGNIGTFTKYKGKNSLDDVQRSCYPDNWQCKTDVDTIKGLLIERSSGDLRAAATITDTIEMFPQVKEIFERWPMLYNAPLLEGNVKGMSVHAAGLVVANDPLTNVCAVYARYDPQGRPKVDEVGNPMEVVSLDKYDAEYLNVMKLDALGLKTMGMIRHCLEQIGMSLEELYALPLDDADTIAGFREGDVVGVFQFDGRAMRSVNAGVIPDNFNEVCDINALARPGPLHSGATAEYMDVKHGRRTPVHYDSTVDAITRHTQYQIVYQEQILQVVRLLGNFSWEEAARIRKIISKKRGEQEFNSMRAKFIAGAATHGMNAGSADRVFSLLATAGAYAFNAAHCVSYGMLAYWTMWLKRHHPAAFYAASLRKCGDDEKGKRRRDQLLRDAVRKGLEIGRLRMNVSEAQWRMDPDRPDVLLPGFRQIHGIGPATADAILEHREVIGRFTDWDDLLDIKGIGPATVEVIETFSAAPDAFGLEVLSDKLRNAKQLLEHGVEIEDEYWRKQRLPAPTHTSAEVPYERTDADVQVVWLGVIRERNLKDLFELHHSRTGEHLDPDSVKDPQLNEWVVMTGEDDTDPLVVTVDRWKYPHMKDDVWSIDVGKDLVLVRGLKKRFQSRRAVYVTDMWVINTED